MAKINLKKFGQRIKKLRKEKGLRQLDLALIVSVSEGYIGSIEQGLRYPSLRVLEKIAKTLKTSPSDLLDY